MLSPNIHCVVGYGLRVHSGALQKVCYAGLAFSYSLDQQTCFTIGVEKSLVQTHKRWWWGSANPGLLWLTLPGSTAAFWPLAICHAVIHVPAQISGEPVYIPSFASDALPAVDRVSERVSNLDQL